MPKAHSARPLSWPKAENRARCERLNASDLGDQQRNRTGSGTSTCQLCALNIPGKSFGLHKTIGAGIVADLPSVPFSGPQVKRASSFRPSCITGRMTLGHRMSESPSVSESWLSGIARPSRKGMIIRADCCDRGIWRSARMARRRGRSHDQSYRSHSGCRSEIWREGSGNHKYLTSSEAIRWGEEPDHRVRD